MNKTCVKNWLYISGDLYWISLFKLKCCFLDPPSLYGSHLKLSRENCMSNEMIGVKHWPLFSEGCHGHMWWQPDTKVPENPRLSLLSTLNFQLFDLIIGPDDQQWPKGHPRCLTVDPQRWGLPRGTASPSLRHPMSFLFTVLLWQLVVFGFSDLPIGDSYFDSPALFLDLYFPNSSHNYLRFNSY